MTVVDSSVWIGLDMHRSNAESAKLTVLLTTSVMEVVVGDVIIHQVLCGIKLTADRRATQSDLEQFTVVEMVSTPSAIRAADRYAFLRAKGITIRSAFDVMIASYCIDEGWPLFRRRLWVLMGIGLLHLLLLWFGDILTTYTLCGFGLLAVRKATGRA